MSRFPPPSDSEYNESEYEHESNLDFGRRDDGAVEVEYDHSEPLEATESGFDHNVRASSAVSSAIDDGSLYTRPASAHRKSAESEGGLGYPYSHGEVERRVAGARRALADALAAYWADGQPPDLSVLRDGLLMLNAGHELDDSYRALLLRAALTHRRGIITALSHQMDPERTAVIVHDALVDGAGPLSPDELARVVREDLTFDLWEPYLRGELRTTARQYEPKRRYLAEVALAVLDGDPLQLTMDANALAVAELELEESLDRRSRVPLLVSILLTLAIVVTAFIVLQSERSRTHGMIAIPGGIFTLVDRNGTAQSVALSSYLIDAMETTNGQYRQCVQRGACPRPDSNNSTTHAIYYDDPAFENYPVVHVDWNAATAYCAWTRRRLPTDDEWHVAAGFAPATQRVYAYPWGDQYVSGLANDANWAAGDLLAGGQFRPAGDSLMGLSDMAGNAAEWTATIDQDMASGYWIKGGSFRDGPELIRLSGAISLQADQSNAWVGFRCAATSLDSSLMNWFDR